MKNGSKGRINCMQPKRHSDREIDSRQTPLQIHSGLDCFSHSMVTRSGLGSTLHSPSGYRGVALDLLPTTWPREMGG